MLANVAIEGCYDEPAAIEEEGVAARAQTAAMLI